MSIVPQGARSVLKSCAEWIGGLPESVTDRVTRRPKRNAAGPQDALYDHDLSIRGSPDLREIK